MTTEANCPCSGYVLSHLSMAGFNPIIYGRFWVITEACRFSITDKIHKKVSQTKIEPGTRTAKFLWIDSPYDLRTLDHQKLQQMAVQEMRRSRHTLGVAITYREANPHFRHHYSVLGVLNQNGLPDFPDFARTLEVLREKEITTDPITGWKYPRSW